VSLNRAARILLRAGAALEASRRRANVVVRDPLNDLIGSWSKAEESEFLQAIGGLEEIDPPLWR